MLAGYLGGWVDQVIMRITDAWLALPAIVFAIFLATMVIPFEVLAIPLYIEMRAFHWVDTYQALIIPFVASPLGMFLLRQFLRRRCSEHPVEQRHAPDPRPPRHRLGERVPQEFLCRLSGQAGEGWVEVAHQMSRPLDGDHRLGRPFGQVR